MPKTIIVVPCYNEEKRLDIEGYRRFLASPEIELLFVNDGSKDGTPMVLAALCERLGERTSYVDLPVNVGKAEAVPTRAAPLSGRRGRDHRLFRCRSGDVAGRDDPAGPHAQRARGNRCPGGAVGLLGTRIERSHVRHYVGRVFATIASFILKIRVYDTQCGAKSVSHGAGFP